MVLDELGKSSRLYPGSFSDFVSYDENTVEKE
jgi:thiosulfate/3-mercaptopyruvate sulfurtransferase